MRLNEVSINENEEVFINGKRVENLIGYKLEPPTDSSEPAKLTVSMYVMVGQVCSESQK